MAVSEPNIEWTGWFTSIIATIQNHDHMTRRMMLISARLHQVYLAHTVEVTKLIS